MVEGLVVNTGKGCSFVISSNGRKELVLTPPDKQGKY